MARLQAIVVGRHQHGDADLVELFENVDDAFGRDLVEVGGGLIGDENCRPVDDCPRDREVLLLATRQRQRTELFARQQAYFVECSARPFCRIARGRAGDQQGKHDIRQHAAIGEQMGVLKDQAETASQIRDGMGTDAADVEFMDHHFAASRGLDRSQNFQQGGFSGARVTREKDEFPCVNPQSNAAQGDVPARVGFMNLVEVDQIYQRSRFRQMVAGKCSQWSRMRLAHNYTRGVLAGAPLRVRERL